MAKLKEPLLFSTYRDRSLVYGEGNNSGNRPCEIESFNSELLNPDLCMVCATTRYDPLLPYIGNRLGHGRDYYKLYCTSETDFEEKGSTGFISRGPALYGLYLAKVKAFYDEHTEPVVNATGEMEQDKTLLFSPLILHVNFWGQKLNYPSYIQNIAEQLIDLKDQQLQTGWIYSVDNWTPTQKNLHNKIIEFLSTKKNWDERKIAWDIYKETSNKLGSKKTDPILPEIQEIDILEDTNLDNYFSSEDNEIPF